MDPFLKKKVPFFSRRFWVTIVICKYLLKLSYRPEIWASWLKLKFHTTFFSNFYILTNRRYFGCFGPTLANLPPFFSNWVVANRARIFQKKVTSSRGKIPPPRIPLHGPKIIFCRSYIIWRWYFGIDCKQIVTLDLRTLLGQFITWRRKYY